MNVQTGVSASSVLRAANHVVFVEGSDDDAFDPTVIRELLKANGLSSLETRPIGPCDNVFQAAKAMVWKHPTYYFLADRDGHDAGYVENGWSNFPRPDTYNLLHWRKRELENYFIDPDYLIKCRWLVKTSDEVRSIILSESNRRLFIEAANLVLLKIRAGVLTPPTTWFKQVEKFSSRADALAELQNAAGLSDRSAVLVNLLDVANRQRLLDEVLDDLTGGKAELEYGSGTWLNLLSGKQIFRTIACTVFDVRNASNNRIQGQEQNNEVAKNLLKMPLGDQPDDFQQLVQLLKVKVQENH